MSTVQKIPRYLTVEEVERLKSQLLQDVKYYGERLKTTEKKWHEGTKRLENKVFNAKQGYTIVCLFYATGMRLHEITGLNVDDVSFERAVVRVFSKGHRERECFITESCLKVLEKWLKVRKIKYKMIIMHYSLTTTNSLSISRGECHYNNITIIHPLRRG